MANRNCEACNDLRENVPELLVNGFDSTMCASMKNDTGLKPSAGNNDCTDLDNMNDCLVGSMADEVEDYDVCEWKPFMKKFIPNVWTVTKGINCAICGLWANVHSLWTKVNQILSQLTTLTNKANCTYNSLVALVNELVKTTGGKAFVKYYRDLGAGDSVPYWERVTDDFHPSPLNIYMDSHGASGGSKPADRDYVVIINNCTNYVGFQELHGYVTYYSSGDTRSVATIRQHQAQHPVIFSTEASDTFANFSWTTSGAVLLKKGEHIKVDFYATTVKKGDAVDGDNTRPKVRLHQFVLTWIPVNVEDALDPSDVMKC